MLWKQREQPEQEARQGQPDPREQRELQALPGRRDQPELPEDRECRVSQDLPVLQALPEPLEQEA